MNLLILSIIDSNAVSSMQLNFKDPRDLLMVASAAQEAARKAYDAILKARAEAMKVERMQ